MLQFISFDANAGRDTGAYYQAINGISAARIGKQSRSGKAADSGVIEDNGVGITNISTNAIGQVSASDTLRSIFNHVRHELTAYNNTQAGTTAAVAITTMQGVSWRGAGDSAVVAIGNNGNVIVLNEFHIGGGEVITNVLQPGREGLFEYDEAGYASWRHLEQRLGTHQIRIAVMSDGISKSHVPSQVGEDIEYLISSGQIDFNDPNWAGQLMYRSLNPANHSYKSDDRVVVSVLRPTEPLQQAMIGAFDGVGSGGSDSAALAHAAVEASIQCIYALAAEIVASSENEITNLMRTKINSAMFPFEYNDSKTGTAVRVPMFLGTPEELQKMHERLYLRGIDTVIIGKNRPSECPAGLYVHPNFVQALKTLIEADFPNLVRPNFFSSLEPTSLQHT